MCIAARLTPQRDFCLEYSNAWRSKHHIARNRRRLHKASHDLRQGIERSSENIKDDPFNAMSVFNVVAAFLYSLPEVVASFMKPSSASAIHTTCDWMREVVR